MTEKTKTPSEKLHDTLEAIAGFGGLAKAEPLEKLADDLQALSEICERKIHADTKDRLRLVITKLENDENIGYLESDLIKTWIVGDAAAFRKLESNYMVWMAELKHAVERLTAADLKEVGLKEILEIDAQAKMAHCLVRDILMYVGQRDRAEHFEDNASSWTKETKAQIAELLRAELSQYELSETESG